jgi:lysophospholipase L1-like esterase
MKLRNWLIGFVLLTGTLARCESAKEPFFFHDKESVVFLGDSITEQKLYTTYIEAYTLTRFPSDTFKFRNVGWGGDTAWLRKRFPTNEKNLFIAATGSVAVLDQMVAQAVGAGLERDVLPLKPTAVTVDFSMNDHAYQAFRQDIFRAHVRSQKEIVNVLKKNGARVALLTTQPIEDKRPDPDKDVRNQSLRKFSDGIKEVAAQEGAVFVDQFDPYMKIMLEARAVKPDAFIGGGDAVHPGPAGHTIMAWSILKALNAPALVSCGGLDAANGKVICEKECSLSGVKVADGVLNFDRLDKALPMPIDARAVAALKLAPITDDLNIYMLKVVGLTAASYDVSIDGTKVATLTKEDLDKGFNLATAATPNSLQAAQVLDLVFKKNGLYFERWRKVQLANGAPDRLAELDKMIADFEAQLEVARKPKTHHFEIKPVTK